jgi:probable HAF family extracellular repeat protein
VPAAINNAGQIAGMLQTSQPGLPGQDVAIYQNGKVTDLTAGALGPYVGNGTAYAINQNGDTLLYHGDTRIPEPGGQHYLLRLANGQTYEFQTAVAGNSLGLPVALNDKDQVIGSNYLYSNGQYTLLKDLIPTSSGWSNLYATAINDAGQIVGKGQLTDGAVHAFLMTPVPEPSALALPAIVLAWVGFRVASGGVKKWHQHQPRDRTAG